MVDFLAAQPTDNVGAILYTYSGSAFLPAQSRQDGDFKVAAESIPKLLQSNVLKHGLISTSLFLRIRNCWAATMKQRMTGPRRDAE